MRTLRFALLLCLALLPATASAASWTPIASGQFDVGSPVAASAFDACSARTWGVTASDGVDSNCFDVPQEARGRKFQLYVRAEGAYLGHSLCFFDAGWQISQCTDRTMGFVPSWAAHGSLSATGGTNVRWTLYAFV